MRTASRREEIANFINLLRNSETIFPFHVHFVPREHLHLFQQQVSLLFSMDDRFSVGTGLMTLLQQFRWKTPYRWMTKIARFARSMRQPCWLRKLSEFDAKNVRTRINLRKWLTLSLFREVCSN
jgi:diadenosine tetraphosphate (Ap4A) HIT family hydrolase